MPDDFRIPDGYRVELTDERADADPIGRRYFRWRAERLRRAYPPQVPSYHLRVEKARRSDGRAIPLLWAVVPYQNRLVKEEDRPKSENPVAKSFKRVGSDPDTFEESDR